MIAEFSIYPMAGDGRREIAKVMETLEQTGLPYRLGPMGTCIEGEWHAVMEAIRRCRDAMAAANQRVITTIVIDECVSGTERRLGPGTDPEPPPPDGAAPASAPP